MNDEELGDAWTTLEPTGASAGASTRAYPRGSKRATRRSRPSGSDSSGSRRSQRSVLPR